MAFFQAIFSILGRLFLSAVFLLSSVNKILHWHHFEDVLVTTLCDWHVYSHGNGPVVQLIDYALNWVPLLLGIAVFIELLGGIMVIIGYRVRMGAFILIVFLLCETVLYHPFWVLPDPKREIELLQVLKNVAIIGGLLMIMAFGTGFSRRRPKQAERLDMRE